MPATSEVSVVRRLAQWVRAAVQETVPDNIRHEAARQTFDAIGCALGALDHPATSAARDVAQALGGPPQSTLFFETTQVAAANSIIYNGSLIRALDCNDIFFDNGPSGHPSDNIAVALAVAERVHASGELFLTSIAIGYEIYWRLRRSFRPDDSRNGSHWDPVSISGLVSAAITGVLLDLDEVDLAHALSIAGAESYTLRQVRSDEISMLKASANALVADNAVIATDLAKAGLDGPDRIFEGTHGIFRALEINDAEQATSELLRPIDHWAILDITIKPYPAIGTSQGAIAAALDIATSHHFSTKDIAQVEIRLADIPTTKRQIDNPSSQAPTTRETADHSVPFVVAAALEDGEFGIEQFADDRWLNNDTRSLMRRITQVADPSFNDFAKNGYPAVVTVRMNSGEEWNSSMHDVPGCPTNRLSDDEVATKFTKFARSHLDGAAIEKAVDRLLQIDKEADMAVLVRDCLTRKLR